MKKGIVILVLLMFAATGVFAQAFSMSAGGGGLFDWSFSNGAEAKIGSDKYYTGWRDMGFGAFLFFDATYVEVELSFAYALLTSVMINPSDTNTEKGGNMMKAGASILGKYPFDFGFITVFPLLGVSYHAVIIAKDQDGDKINDYSMLDNIKNLSQFGLLGGVGFDIDLTRSLFLRAEALYQLRLPSKFMSDAGEVYNEIAKLSGGTGYATLGMGPRVKVGVGYRF